MTTARADLSRSRGTTDGYAEYAPPPALSPFVECLWRRTARQPVLPADDGVLRHHVLPDGCVDIVLELGAGVPDAMVVGTMTRALVAESTPGDSFVAVRFRPGMAGAFLAGPVSELTDQRVPLGEVWPSADRVIEAVSAAGTIERRLRTLADALVSGLRSGHTESREVRAAVGRIAAAGGTIEIGALAGSLGVTRQHLARKFAEQVGISPKMFARIARMRRFVERARSAADPDWTALALELGYYDQSHLVDEFRELAGVSPARWFRELGVVPFRPVSGSGDSIFPRNAESRAVR